LRVGCKADLPCIVKKIIVSESKELKNDQSNLAVSSKKSMAQKVLFWQ
jgi:hypothetical protein